MGITRLSDDRLTNNEFVFLKFCARIVAQKNTGNRIEF